MLKEGETTLELSDLSHESFNEETKSLHSSEPNIFGKFSDDQEDDSQELVGEKRKLDALGEELLEKSPPKRTKRGKLGRFEEREDNFEYPSITIPPRDNLKLWEEPIYEDFPNFNFSWILRTLFVKYQKYQYVTKHELNQTVHNSLRRSKTNAKFTIGHIMNAIKHLIDDKDPLIMYHRQEDEIKIPIAFKLTEEGKRIALLLHEQKQGPIKFTISEPPKNRKIQTELDHREDFDFEKQAKRLISEYKKALSEIARLKEELRRLNVELSKYKKESPQAQSKSKRMHDVQSKLETDGQSDLADLTASDIRPEPQNETQPESQNDEVYNSFV